VKNNDIYDSRSGNDRVKGRMVAVTNSVN